MLIYNNLQKHKFREFLEQKTENTENVKNTT